MSRVNLNLGVITCHGGVRDKFFKQRNHAGTKMEKVDGTGSIITES